MEIPMDVGPFIQGTNKGGKTIRKKYIQTIFRDWCKCCGICVAFCPKGVIVFNENDLPKISNPDLCIGCRFCELHCPDFAITIRRKGDLPESLSRVPGLSK
jgi:2-oxoglutarate ferredoxin oxidoreductase subunit delta